jgi:release factor glutamine methyltransferase
MSRSLAVDRELADRTSASSVSDWLENAIRHLSSLAVPEAEVNAEFIMAFCLRIGRSALALERGRPLSPKEARQFWGLVLRRGRREPLAYVLGSQSFLGIDIEVSPSVLIPRPETEELVLEAARLLESRSGEPLNLLEIGTGSGCIAIALAALFPQATIYATEISSSALRLAQKNADRLQRPNIRFLREDLFKPAGSRRAWADLVVSNPPYIPTTAIGQLEAEVRQEPRLALDGGRDGLKALRAVTAQAPSHLKPGSFLVLEIGCVQGPAVLGLLDSLGFKDSSVRKDLEGRDRIAVGRLPTDFGGGTSGSYLPVAKW